MSAPVFAPKQGLFLVLVLLLGVGLGWWLKPRALDGRAASDASVAHGAAPAPASVLAAPASEPEPEAVPVAPAPAATQAAAAKILSVPATPEALQAAERAIDEAALSYDAEAVKLIAPYLTNGDARIRSLARDGLIRASDPSGAKALRGAALRLEDARELAEFLEAAEFLELPPMKPRKKRAAAQSATSTVAQ